MCNGVVDIGSVEQRFDISFTDYFAEELETLTGPGGAVTEGMAAMSEQAIVATELGRVFIRNVAMVFDKYLREKPAPAGPVFSRTV